MSRSVGEICAELRRALSAFEPGLYPASACARIADELAATEKACGAASLLAARRAVQCGAHKEAGYEDPASWMARLSGTTRHQAKADMETARLLEELPATKEAALSGEVSLSQVQEITRSEKETPGAEAELLAVARDGDLSDLKDKAKEHRQEASDPGALHEAQHEARSLRHFVDRLGMVNLRAALAPEVGIPLVNRIERTAQRLRNQAKHDGASPEPFEAHAADALVQLCSGDATARPARAELVIVCDLFAWRRGHAQGAEPCHLVGGGPIPVEVAQELAQDAFVKAVVCDGVEIKTLAHFGRHLKAELRSALDLGPAPSFSGRRCADCGRRYGLEYDHVVPVAAGGPTAYDNLEARCFLCHKAKTEKDRKAGLLRAAPTSHGRPIGPEQAGRPPPEGPGGGRATLPGAANGPSP